MGHKVSLKGGNQVPGVTREEECSGLAGGPYAEKQQDGEARQTRVSIMAPLLSLGLPAVPVLNCFTSSSEKWALNTMQGWILTHASKMHDKVLGI